MSISGRPVIFFSMRKPVQDLLKKRRAPGHSDIFSCFRRLTVLK